MSKSIKISRLHSTKHLFETLAEQPFEKMVNSIEHILKQQVEDSKLTYFEATSNPQWLSEGKPDQYDKGKIIVIRIGVAFEFKLNVIQGRRTEELRGIYSWVRKKVDDKFVTKIWFDLNGTLAKFGNKGVLKERIY